MAGTARILLSFPKIFAKEIEFWEPLFLAVHGEANERMFTSQARQGALAR